MSTHLLAIRQSGAAARAGAVPSASPVDGLPRSRLAAAATRSVPLRRVGKIKGLRGEGNMLTSLLRYNRNLNLPYGMSVIRSPAEDAAARSFCVLDH